jgi:hypothetical protein
MESINQHIQSINNELDDSNTNRQRVRHLKSELNSLEKYKDNHPDDDHDPTPLELYCDENPDALECRIYDD